MEEYNDINDNEIRVIGGGGGKKPTRRGLLVAILIAAVLLLAGIILLVALRGRAARYEEYEQGVFESGRIEYDAVADAEYETEQTVYASLGSSVDSLAGGFTEIVNVTINDIPLIVYIPHNAELSLHIGRMDKQDTTVIFTAQAADVRADNGGIVGAFVLEGKPLSWGLSKKGFCASIDGVVTVGVADNSPLFEEATDKGGYFFRQYPLVSDGQIVENEPKGKSVRRGICDRQGEIFMVESETQESFHDFSQALVDLGVDQAVYLVGGSAFGWAVDEVGEVHKFGDENYYGGRRTMPKNTSYIVWRKK